MLIYIRISVYIIKQFVVYLCVYIMYTKKDETHISGIEILTSFILKQIDTLLEIWKICLWWKVNLAISQGYVHNNVQLFRGTQLYTLPSTWQSVVALSLTVPWCLVYSKLTQHNIICDLHIIIRYLNNRIGK